MGTTPGAFYDFATVRQHTPNPSFFNTLEPLITRHVQKASDPSGAPSAETDP